MHTLRHKLSCIAMAIAASGVSISSYAGCVLPVPDGGVTPPSKPNVVGRVVSINQDIAVIGTNKSSKKTSVRITKDTALHTAFGGVVRASELKVGQNASVWFVGCKHSGKSAPVAAYFQIFSKASNDQP